MKKSGKLNISVLGNIMTDHCEKDKNLSRLQKYLYSAICVFIHFTFGITISSMAPAFVDFATLLDVNMKWIGLFPTFQAVGTLAGAIGTISFKWVNRQIVLSILVMGQGLATIFMPYSTELWHLYLCILVYGIGVGAWNGSINVILIEMWQKRSPSILQFSQFMWGIGTIVGPLLVSDFLLGKMVCPGVFPDECLRKNLLELNDSTITTTYGPNVECTEQCLHYDRRPRLKIPYLIGGCIMLIGPIAMSIMYIIKRYEYKNSGTIEVAVTEEQKARHKQYVPTKTILTFVSLFYAFGIMSENMFTDWVTTFFQYQPTLHLTAELAAQVMSTISIALSVGRLLSVFAAMYLKPQYMILFQMLIVFVGWVFLIFGQDQLELLWASSVLIGLGYSSIFICMFSFVGQFMEVTDKIGGLFIASYNVIYMFLPFFISEEIPIYPSSYLYIEISCISVGIIAFIIALFSVRNVPKDLIRKLGPIAGH